MAKLDKKRATFMKKCCTFAEKCFNPKEFLLHTFYGVPTWNQSKSAKPPASFVAKWKRAKR